MPTRVQPEPTLSQVSVQRTDADPGHQCSQFHCCQLHIVRTWPLFRADRFQSRDARAVKPKLSENYDFLPALDDKRGLVVDAILFTNLP
jgi:hypothetical protein